MPKFKQKNDTISQTLKKISLVVDVQQIDYKKSRRNAKFVLELYPELYQKAHQEFEPNMTSKLSDMPKGNGNGNNTSEAARFVEAQEAARGLMHQIDQGINELQHIRSLGKNQIDNELYKDILRVKFCGERVKTNIETRKQLANKYDEYIDYTDGTQKIIDVDFFNRSYRDALNAFVRSYNFGELKEYH